MFLDASAIVAILAREDDAALLLGRAEQAGRLYTSPIAIWEAIAGLARISGDPQAAEDLVNAFIETIRAEIVTISAAIGREATAAYRLYGKGRHPAALNMGDCFAYAAAKVYRLPLLAKGNDFPRTDARLA